MFGWIFSVLRFSRMLLHEYFYSGRIMIELLASGIFTYLFFWPQGNDEMRGERFFALAGLFVVCAALYTAARMIELGYRPQAYIFLLSPLDRRGFLIGVYLAAIIFDGVLYLFLSLGIRALYAGYGRPYQIALAGWLLGSLPLLLVITLVTAVVLLLSQAIFLTESRLSRASLAVVALLIAIVNLLDFSGYPLSIFLQYSLGLPVVLVQRSLALAVNQMYTPADYGLLLIEVCFTVALVYATLAIFDRRDLTLRPG